VTRAERLAGTEAERLAAIAEIAAGADASAADLEGLAACLGAERKAVQRRAAEALAALDARGVPVRARLARVLAQGPPRARFGAAWALATAGETSPATHAVLLDALGDADGDLRWAAADLLVRVRFADGPARLRDLVATGSGAARKMALYCLRDLGAAGPDVERTVLGALDDPDPGVRLAAMAALARLACDRDAAAARLTGALASGPPALRRAAAAALGTLGRATPAVLAALDAAAGASDPALRRAAAGALRALARAPA